MTCTLPPCTGRRGWSLRTHRDEHNDRERWQRRSGPATHLRGLDPGEAASGALDGLLGVLLVTSPGQPMAGCGTALPCSGQPLGTMPGMIQYMTIYQLDDKLDHEGVSILLHREGD